MQQHRSLTIFISSLLIVIVAAVFYLGGETAPEQDSQAASGADSTERRGGTDTATRRSSGAGNGSAGDLGPQVYPSQTEKVILENYSGFATKPQWEKDLITIADRRDMADVDKAVQILSRINQLPEDAKVVAMDYATKLIPDKDYLRLRPWVFQFGASDELRETILLDALTRGDTVRMPTLVEMLRQPKHSGHEEVREILVAYLDEDHGHDAQKWDVAIKKWLIENPEE
jgi:hypothetical protein